MWSHVIGSIRYSLCEKWEKVLPQKPQSFSEPHWARQKHTGSACDMCSCPSCGVWMHVVGKRKTEKKKMQKFVNLDSGFLAFIGYNQTEAKSVSIQRFRDGVWIRNLHRSARLSPARLNHVTYIDWWDSGVLAGFTSARQPGLQQLWRGPGWWWWVIFLAQFLSPQFPSSGTQPGSSQPAVLRRGPSFSEPFVPFVAQEKSAGLLGWEWIYVFALLRSMNGSEGLRVRKHGAATQL